MSDTEQTEAVTTTDPTEGSPTGQAEGGANGGTGGNGAEAVPAGPTTDVPPVHVAIARVIARLPSIEKADEAPAEMGGYKYRGIERIMSAAQKIMADEGVVFYAQHRLIRYEEAPPGWNRNERTHRVWTEATWTVLGPAGDPLDPPPITQGYALDGSDKALNKAHTQAKKYMLMDLLQIADKVADADGQPFDPGPETQDRPRDDNPIVDEAQALALVARAKKLPDEQRAELAAQWKQEDPMTGQSYLPLDPENGKPAFRLLRQNDVPAVEAILLRLEKAAKAAPESVADRAERMAAEHAGKPQPEAAEPAPVAPEAPATAAGGEAPAETAQGDTAAEDGPADRLAGVAPMMIPDDWGDLAEQSSQGLVDILTGLRRRVPADVLSTVEHHVGNLKHPSHVNAQVTAVDGQTLGDPDNPQHIDVRRMRVTISYLCGWLTEHRESDG
jgi:hypothetical protein